MTFTLRYMEMGDVPQVVAIDKMSFDLPWSTRSYNYEISESTYSHMVVIEQIEDTQPGSWQRLMHVLRGKHAEKRKIVGYGGLWHIVDEAHISTIASHPEWRGRGLGEILLAGMIRRALTLGAEYMVLEVRVSNTRAQKLYQKYHFEIVDTKPKYYRNNDEDAYDMRLQLDASGIRESLEAKYAALCVKHPFVDHYGDFPAPHGQK